MEVSVKLGTSVDKETVKDKILKIEKDKVDKDKAVVKSEKSSEDKSQNDKDEEIKKGDKKEDKEIKEGDKEIKKGDKESKKEEKTNDNNSKKEDKQDDTESRKDKPEDKESKDKQNKGDRKKETPKGDTKEGKTKEDGEEKKESHINSGSEKIRGTPLGREIKACEMKEDEEGSRFPQYRGYALALAGPDYTMVACGIGEVEGEALPPRDITYKINETTLLASHGFHNDVIHFNRDMQKKIDQCVETLGKQMSLLGTAGIVKALLYSRRFHTFFKCNILAGLDQHGGGCLYVFDQMGGFRREAYAAGGSHCINMQNLLTRKINLTTPRSVQVPVNEDEAAEIMTDVFRSAAKQKIFNGHAVVIHRITTSGVVEEFRKVKD